VPAIVVVVPFPGTASDAPLERAGWTRLRWRMRGAWMWPAFLACTVGDGLLLHELPVWGDGMPVVPALLFCGFVNLVVVAVVAPGVGRLLRRRRRPDLPQLVANDYAGTALIGGVSALLVLGGVLHHPAVAAHRRAFQAQAAAARNYLLAAAPARLHARLSDADTLKLTDGLYRTCVPERPRRAFCVLVRTSQDPPVVREDPSRAPNARYSRSGALWGP
jgi:hypothetical protein